ncbi:MAG: ATP-binding cassette domain-containing protein, partial [Nitrososphaeraceae archaeon]
MAKIVVKDVTKRFVESKTGTVVTAIEDINFNIDEGQFVCLVGPSGCGKSTMLNILAGLETPSSGTVVLNGKPIAGTGPD